MEEKQALIPTERIEKAILLIRGQKVILDRDLAELYQVPTKVLNQAVRRNQGRFPTDFMFQLSKDELENWRSQFVTSNSAARMGLRRRPFAFTEQGVAMLSSVLNSERAVQGGEIDKQHMIGIDCWIGNDDPQVLVAVGTQKSGAGFHLPSSPK